MFISKYNSNLTTLRFQLHDNCNKPGVSWLWSRVKILRCGTCMHLTALDNVKIIPIEVNKCQLLRCDDMFKSVFLFKQELQIIKLVSYFFYIDASFHTRSTHNSNFWKIELAVSFGIVVSKPPTVITPVLSKGSDTSTHFTFRNRKIIPGFTILCCETDEVFFNSILETCQ